MIGNSDTMDLWLLQAKHIYDEYYSVVGIYNSEHDVEVAKNLYLDKQEDAGLTRSNFYFIESKHELGDIEY